MNMKIAILKATIRMNACSIKSDELWFWHAGCALNVIELVPPVEACPSGGIRSAVLGPGPGLTRFTHCVPGGTTFGCFVPRTGLSDDSSTTQTWSLVSCVVVPGFDFEDWLMPSRSEIFAQLCDAALGAGGSLSARDLTPLPIVQSQDDSNGPRAAGEPGPTAKVGAASSASSSVLAAATLLSPALVAAVNLLSTDAASPLPSAPLRQYPDDESVAQ